MSNPLVSIVIPTFNYGPYLGEAIESALNQTYSPVEIVVMDDGSTDNTPEVAASFGSKIKYIRTPNQGVYTTRQASLEHIHGDYFLNLDADNILHPECLTKTVSFLQAIIDPRCVFVYTQHCHIGDSSGFTHFPTYDLAQLKLRNYIDMGALIKTDIVRRFGFDPAFNTGYGDYDFFLTLAEHGYRGVLLNEPLLFYRIHTTSITHSVNKSFQQVKIVKRLVAKHHALYTLKNRRQAMNAARDRILQTLVHNRKPDRPLRERLADFARIFFTPAGPEQIWAQFKHIFTT